MRAGISNFCINLKLIEAIFELIGYTHACVETVDDYHNCIGESMANQTLDVTAIDDVIMKLLWGKIHQRFSNSIHK